MATSQQFLLCDNTNATNFKNWAQAISNFIRTAGWTNSTDTGQLNGAGPGPGGWASVSTVPGSGLFYYEIFQPGDGLQNFYLKMEYGNSPSSTNSPTLRVSVGITTNGAGVLTGFTIGTYTLASTSFTAPSTTVTYECDLSGDSGRLSFLLWRNAPNTASQVFAIQRSLNASGSAYGTSSTGYITIWGAGKNSSNQTGNQQSLAFGIGAAPAFQSFDVSNTGLGWPCMRSTNGNASNVFNGSIPMWNLQPCVGFWDYPCTAVAVCSQNDISEGVPFTVTNQYGQTKTYMPTHVVAVNVVGLSWVSNPSGDTTHGAVGVLVEYD